MITDSSETVAHIVLHDVRVGVLQTVVENNHPDPFPGQPEVPVDLDHVEVNIRHPEGSGLARVLNEHEWALD